MATLVLQAAGAFLGSALGPVGAVIGRAAGAMAGYAIDQAIINGTRRLEGPRLNDPRPFSAEDGAALPRIYGTMRTGGTLIWATRFEEEARSERQGAKGGPKITNYSYFANVAFALCEGPIAHVRRIWADGRELDQTRFQIRVHQGSEDQMPDPLIEAKQGAGNAPTMRGTAYVVFERFPLADYGNRVPQFQFEVLRPVGSVAVNVRAITLIPGATEYGLSPSPVTLEVQPGETQVLNRHVLHQESDFAAALDELQAVCPNLVHVGLVATWFGTDLRAGFCQIRPGVTQGSEDRQSDRWKVAGVSRSEAMVVSTHGGSAAYGGSPSDRSLITAIREIKARGLRVTLYPFIMMDVPQGNALPDPYGTEEQSAYPWRGRITCHPAAGVNGSVDATPEAERQIAAFAGGTRLNDFTLAGEEVRYAGPAEDWSYRRFILHFAQLAKLAGGVDAFLIGSELRGVTQVQGPGGTYPFVDALCEITGDVRTILGPDVALTYAADWSEYFGHQPVGTSDLRYHLDPLWAHPAINAVGIDNYMPLADWRDHDVSGGNPDGAGSSCDVQAMRRSIASGEGYDWYYASMEDRHQRKRSAISDWAHGKDWVWRYKDLRNWWGNFHHDRIGGVEQIRPSEWVPQSKPIWFTELGCPASDKGPNQPNVFPDPKSSESALPYYSTGGRDDAAQLGFIKAHQMHWDEAGADFVEADNPRSALYDGRMVDAERIYLWTWDARPFPAFPQRGDQWSDGDNWLLGHWLNGRLSTIATADLIHAILDDHDLPQAMIENVPGSLHGYVAEEPGTARAALEPIISLFGLNVRDDGAQLRFAGQSAQSPILVSDIVLGQDGDPAIRAVRIGEGEVPTKLTLAFRDPFADYQAASASVEKPDQSSLREQNLMLPASLEQQQATALLADRLRDHWAGRETISFATAPSELDLMPGAMIRLEHQRQSADFLITHAETGDRRSIQARQLRRVQAAPWRVKRPIATAIAEMISGPPHVLMLDLPMMPGETRPEDQFRVAVWSTPWSSQILFASAEQEGFGQRSSLNLPARIGRLVESLHPGVSGRRDWSQKLVVDLPEGALSSRSMVQMLNGGGSLALLGRSGDWEILQFQQAQEIAAGRWQLNGLLRGQLGSEFAMLDGAEIGSDLVLLDECVKPAGLLASEIGLLLNWRIGPAGHDLSDRYFQSNSAIGGERALLPLGPVHLRCRKGGGEFNLSWIRRSRIDADRWEGLDIPLAEESELYQVQIRSVENVLKRSFEVRIPSATYSLADMVRDFGTMPEHFILQVCQMSSAIGQGSFTQKIIST